jgi:hypothetical protein
MLADLYNHPDQMWHILLDQPQESEVTERKPQTGSNIESGSTSYGLSAGPHLPLSNRIQLDVAPSQTPQEGSGFCYQSALESVD